MTNEEYPPRERRSDLEWSDEPPALNADVGAINTPSGPIPIVGAEVEPHEQNPFA